jgi:hypothetical protein
VASPKFKTAFHMFCMGPLKPRVVLYDVSEFWDIFCVFLFHVVPVERAVNYFGRVCYFNLNATLSTE